MPVDPAQQPLLLDEKPLARKTDHHSSHAAADRMQRTGKLEEQRAQVLALVKKHPYRTSKELGDLSEELDRYAIARRLPELEAVGKVKGFRKEGRQIRWTAEPEVRR